MRNSSTNSTTLCYCKNCFETQQKWRKKWRETQREKV